MHLTREDHYTGADKCHTLSLPGCRLKLSLPCWTLTERSASLLGITVAVLYFCILSLGFPTPLFCVVVSALSLLRCRFHIVASTLSLPRCRFHVVAFKLSLPLCRFQVVASTLSLPSCRFLIFSSQLSLLRGRSDELLHLYCTCLL